MNSGRIEEAANALYKYFNERFFIREVLLDIKKDEFTNAFDNGTGKAIRDTLAEIGFGDVQDEYLKILRHLYDRVGIK